MSSDQWTTKFQTLKRDFDQLRRDSRLEGLQREISSLTAQIDRLPGAIEALAGRGYAFTGALTGQVRDLTAAWQAGLSALQAQATQEAQRLQNDFRRVEMLMADADRNANHLDALAAVLPALERDISTLRREIQNVESGLRQRFATPKSQADTLHSAVKDAEWALEQLGESLVDFEANEHLFSAAKVEWVATGKGKDDPDGLLFLTDQRLIFERKEKTGKVLGLFGGKKTQEVGWAVAITDVSGVDTERKGFFGGKKMLIIQLKPGAPHSELTVEVKGGASNTALAEQIMQMAAGQLRAHAAPPEPSVSLPVPPPAPAVAAVPVPQSQGTGLGGGAVVMVGGGGGSAAAASAPPAAESEAPATGRPYSASFSPPPADEPPFMLQDLEWVFVPGGDGVVNWVIAGDAREGVPPEHKALAYTLADFRISRAPITNTQWQAFEDDPDGYQNKRWWEFATEAMIARRSQPFRSGTLDNDDSGDEPRTAISYFDALAFCAWLSAKTGLDVSLPSEPELRHAFAQRSEALLRPARVREWTVSDHYTMQERLTGAMRAPLDAANKRTLAASGAYENDLGFRVVISGRVLAPAVVRGTTEDMLERLRARRARTMQPVPPEGAEVALLRDASAVPVLLEMLNHENMVVRAGAAFALRWLADSIPVPPDALIAYIASENEAYARTLAAAALIDSGAPAVPSLIVAAAHTDRIVRREAVNALGALYVNRGLREDALLNVLVNSLGDPDGDVVIRALAWLRAVDSDRVRDAVYPLHTDARADVREKAIEVLRAWGLGEGLTSQPVGTPAAVTLDASATSTPTRTAAPQSMDVAAGMTWRRLLAGEVTITREERTGQYETKTVEQTYPVAAFEISAMPVTVAQFGAFLNAGDGYANKHWWEYHYVAMEERGRRPQLDTRDPDAPCSDINWWTAIAFGFWLSAQSGELYALPTEQQWQRALETGAVARLDAITEWCYVPETGRELPYYGRGDAIVRGAGITGGDYLTTRRALIALGREERLSFRLVRTGLPFSGLPPAALNLQQAISAIEGGGMLEVPRGFQALAMLADASSIDWLVGRLADKNEHIRRQAVHVLGWIADRQPVPLAPLVQVLADAPRVFNTAVDALREIGSPAVPVLRQAAASADNTLRNRAITTLAVVEGQSALPVLLDALQNDRDAEVRASAASAIGHLGARSAADALRSALRDPSPKVAQRAQSVLDEMDKRIMAGG